MTVAHLVVHLEDVMREARTDQRAKKALDHINSLDADLIYFIPHGTDPRKIPFDLLSSFEKGNFDSVKIHGAYYGLCLNATHGALACSGISSTYSRRGIIYTQ